jgi:hypothetical protein
VSSAGTGAFAGQASKPGTVVELANTVAAGGEDLKRANHFIVFRATQDSIKGRAVFREGKVFDEFEIQKTNRRYDAAYLAGAFDEVDRLKQLGEEGQEEGVRVDVPDLHRLHATDVREQGRISTTVSHALSLDRIGLR